MGARPESLHRPLRGPHPAPRPDDPMKRRLTAVAAALACGAAQMQAQAQDYPSKPLRFITQFSPGSSGDVVVRTIATHLSPVMAQPIVVENRSGAGGVQAAEAGARSAPDGY